MCVACVEENAFFRKLASTSAQDHLVRGERFSCSGWWLEQCRLALAHADAERREPVPAAPAAQLVQERDDQTGAAHPEG